MAVAFACSLLGPLASACVFDLRERRIPNGLVAGMVALWCVLSICSIMVAKESLDAWALVTSGIAGACLLGGGSFCLACAFERVTGCVSMGGGDVKLLFALGLYLGCAGGLACLFVACAASVALRFIIPRTSFAQVPGSVHGQIPFAPALFVGAVCTFAMGQLI